MDRMLIARAATLALIIILIMTFLRLSALFLSSLDFTLNIPSLNPGVNNTLLTGKGLSRGKVSYNASNIAEELSIVLNDSDILRYSLINYNII